VGYTSDQIADLVRRAAVSVSDRRP
jgi:hypothetical protein